MAVGGAAAAVAVAQLGLFLTARSQAQAIEVLADTTAEPVWLSLARVLAAAGPWLIAAVASLCDRRRPAVVIVLTAGAPLVAVGLGALAGLTVGGGGSPERPSGWLAAAGAPVLGALAAMAMVIAWRGRPAGGWRLPASGPPGWYVAAALLAWLPAMFTATQVAPPGAPRAFVSMLASSRSGVQVGVVLATAVVAAVILFAAPRLRRRPAGVVLATYAWPRLLTGLGDVHRVATADHVIPTPAGVLGGVGLVAIAAIGLAWMRGPREPAQ